MGYSGIFKSDMRIIINRITENKIEGQDGAIEAFKEYLQSVSQLGPYNKKEWKNEWTTTVYEFGLLFQDRDSKKFLDAINALISQTNDSSIQEVLKFIESEILFNQFTKDQQLEHFNGLVKEFPNNFEFRHSYANILHAEEKVLSAIEYLEPIVKNSENPTFSQSLMSVYLDYVNYLFAENRFDEAEGFINSIIAKDLFTDAFHFKNRLNDAKRRIQDHKIINERIETSSKEIDRRTEEKFDQERKKTIEILALFSVVITFILTSVSVIKVFTFKEAISFMIAFGLTLLLFLIGASCIASPLKQSRSEDVRIWFGGFTLVCLLTIMASIWAV